MAPPGSGTVRRRMGSNPTLAHAGSVEGSRENTPGSAGVGIHGTKLVVRRVRDARPTPYFFVRVESKGL